MSASLIMKDETTITKPEQQVCLCCGKCCLQFGQETMIVDNDDVARWIREERWGILQYLDNCHGLSLSEYHNCAQMVLGTGKQCEGCTRGYITNPHKTSWRCIFFSKVRNKPNYRCGIQETKPNHCKRYPVGKWIIVQQSSDEKRNSI